jgi:Xaa-Pro aminopeptidase
MSLNRRKKKASAAAKAAGVEALLVTHLPDVRWLCGFTGSNAALVLVPGRGSGRSGARAVLFTDGRYTTQAKAEAVGTQVVIATNPVVTAACEWMAAAGVTRCGFDEGNTSVVGLKQMRAAVPAGVQRKMFEPVGLVAAKLRWVKDADEIVKMRARRRWGAGCSTILGKMQRG